MTNDMNQFNQRARQLVEQMTVEEKIAQMMNDAPAIERLGIPAYDWWNESLHGVARAGIATVFPQAIGLAATWNVPLHHRVATMAHDRVRVRRLFSGDQKLGGSSSRTESETQRGTRAAVGRLRTCDIVPA